MKKNHFTYTILMVFLFLIAGTSNAQDIPDDDFVVLKTIDEVQFSIKHSVCNDGEFILVKAVNTSTDTKSLTLTPTWEAYDESFSSATNLTINLEGNETIEYDCSSDVKISVYEFFSMYDDESQTLDLIQN